jgi:hypothetical protein
MANYGRRWWILAVLGIAQLMVILDGTIVNIALPSAQHDLHFSSADRQATVLALLERHRVSRRGRVLTPDHIERAVSSYASGRSCASIGKELPVNPETVRQALLKVGVAMRRPGRPPATTES